MRQGVRTGRISRIEIRACTADDLERLRRSWATPGDVAGSHFAEQQDGHAAFLVAWHDHEPLGWAVIQWTGCLGRNARAAYPASAEVMHLQVRPDYRDRGAGSALIEAAERAAAERRIENVAISVGRDNPRAARLYARHGYRPTGITDVCEYDWMDDAGTARHEREVNELLVKRVRPAAAG